MTESDLQYYINHFDDLTYDQYTEAMRLSGSVIRRGTVPDSIAKTLAPLRATFQPDELEYFDQRLVHQIVEPIDLTDIERQFLKLFGFYSESGYFLLDHRFIVEIHDTAGRIISFVGWYPDNRKYITIASKYFSKQIDWFNIDYAMSQLDDSSNKVIYVVEGIFDALSIASLGLPVIATMGSNVNSVKGQLLNLFDTVVEIPDGDDVGRKGLKYWYATPNTIKVVIDFTIELPITTKDSAGIEHTEIKKLKIKDIDDLIKYIDPVGVRNLLNQIATSNNKIEFIKN